MGASSEPQDRRPSKADFAASDDDLDGMCAWNNFGGLSRQAAFEKFCECPEVYQEDFMFMGGVAFSYYYSVIERYILESRIEDNCNNDVESMWILAHCIKQQLQANDAEKIEQLRRSITELVNYVRRHLEQYAVDPGERERLDDAWHELDSIVRTNSGFSSGSTDSQGGNSP